MKQITAIIKPFKLEEVREALGMSPEPEAADVRRSRPELMPSIGHIGRYALKYKIGEGGLGTVYAAHDPLLSRLIAIKTLNVDLPAQDREIRGRAGRRADAQRRTRCRN